MSSPGQGKGKNRRKGKGRGQGGRGRGRGQDPPSTPGKSERVGKLSEESGIPSEEKPGCSNPKDTTSDFDEKSAGACGYDVSKDTLEEKLKPEERFETPKATTSQADEDKLGASCSASRAKAPSKSKKNKQQRSTPSTSSGADSRGKTAN